MHLKRTDISNRMAQCTPVMAQAMALVICIFCNLQLINAQSADMSARDYYQSASTLQLNEDWHGAIETYLLAIAKNPNYGEAYAGLGECYYRLGEFQESLNNATKARVYLRSDLSLANVQGFDNFSLGNIDAARKNFAEVLAVLPNNIDARFGSAVLTLSAGRFNEAQTMLQKALVLAPRDNRISLSLSLLAAYSKDSQKARSYLEQGLSGSDAHIQFIAAQIMVALGDRVAAAKYAKNALALRSTLNPARILLADIAFSGGDNNQVVEIIQADPGFARTQPRAAYALALAQARLGDLGASIASATMAVSKVPNDEFFRLALENAVVDSLKIEDAARKPYSDFHLAKGKSLETKGAFDDALFEYRRALKIYPFSADARLAYARLYKITGYPGRYLSELEVLMSAGTVDQSVQDAVEVYKANQSDSLAATWGITEATLAKRPYSLAIFQIPNDERWLHPGAENLVGRYLDDILSSSSAVSVSDAGGNISSFAQGFRAAREAGADYFAIIEGAENAKDCELVARIYVGRTGAAARELYAFRTGNDRLKGVCMAIANSVLDGLPPLGQILAMERNTIAIDLGRMDGVVVGQKLNIVAADAVLIEPEGMALGAPAASILGEATVTKIGELISEASVAKSGFFNRIGVGDKVFATGKAVSNSVTAAPAQPGAATGTSAGAAASAAQRTAVATATANASGKVGLRIVGSARMQALLVDIASLR